MPVLYVGGDTNNIACVNDLNGTTFHLHSSGAPRDDEYLSEWMRMPGTAGTRSKGDDATRDARWSVHGKELFDLRSAGEELGDPATTGLSPAWLMVSPVLLPEVAVVFWPTPHGRTTNDRHVSEMMIRIVSPLP